MNGHQTLIARGAFGLLAGAASIVACSSATLRRLSDRSLNRLAILALPLSRLSLFAIIFLVLRLAPRGDVPSYYWPEALSALRGMLPYRDFVSSYAPLHPYLDAAVITLWHSPLAIILFSILAETAILPLWLHCGRRFLSREEIRTATLLYLSSAISLQFVTIDGQDTVIVAVALVLSLFFLARGKELLSGLPIGIAVAVLKFLPLLYAPAFFFSLRRRWRWTVGLLLPILAVYGFSAAIHLDILVPLRREGAVRGAGSLPYLIESLLGITLPSRLWDLLLLAVLASIFLFIYRVTRNASPETRLRVIAFSIPALTLALLLFSKKSWPPYLMLTLFPLGLLIDGRRRLEVAGFALVNFVAVTEHSYWSSLLAQLDANQLHRGLLSGHRTYFLFLTLELLLLAGYAWLLLVALNRIASAPEFLEDDSRPEEKTGPFGDGIAPAGLIP